MLLDKFFEELDKMPRFTDSQLSQLKTDISLVRLIESQGYKITK